MAIAVSSFADIEFALGTTPAQSPDAVQGRSPHNDNLAVHPTGIRSRDNDFFQKRLGQLATKAIGTTRAKFQQWGHSPSKEHWKGLEEIARVYEGMADGTASENRFMSSLPPGMGKTTIAIEATKAFLADDRFKGQGVIYFLSRLEEIETLANLMGLPKEEFAAVTSSDEINALGNPVPEKARVLFTTQQRLEQRVKDGTSFADIKDFRFHGRPRIVKVWDEAILPSRTLTLNRDSLFGLLKTLRPVKPELADVLEDFAVSLRTFDGERINMPDIDREGIDLEEFVNHFTSPDHKADAEQLWYLSGRVVRVRREGPKGPTTLDYEDILPADLAPMLILDASGGLRKTYDFWSKHRGELKTLYSPQKSYSGLTIHHFDRAAGKSKHHHRKDVKELADDVVKMIAEIPDHEAVLVVHHKAKPKNPDIVSAIQEGLPDRLGEVRFVNWGRHTATNEFADIKNVILAGILQYNLAQYEATGRAAKRATVEDEFSEDDFRATRIGEISHHIFQAAGRGAIRKTENGGCPQGCDLYTVFSTHKVTGFPKEQLLTIFPDADLVDWSPDGEKVERRLTGNLRKTVETIKSAIALGGRITTVEVREIVGMDRRNFNSLIAGDAFKQATSAIPYAREKGKAGVWG